jgi:hypothetical protein
MAHVYNSIKKTWLKGMVAVGNAASSIAVNSKQKVTEMNLESRRREILADFSLIAYEMWQKGTSLPKELDDQLTELRRLDEELNALRAQRYANMAEGQSSAADPAAPDNDDDRITAAEEAQGANLPADELSDVPKS